MKRMMVLLSLLSTLAFAQQQTAVVDATTTATTTGAWLEGSSAQLWNYAKVGYGSKSTTYGVEPHFVLPVLNKLATLDIYGEFSMGEDSAAGRSTIQNPAGIAELKRVFVDNEYLTLDPYVAFGNLFNGESKTVAPTFSGVAKLPIQFASIKLEPYILNESSATFYTGAKKTTVDYLAKSGDQTRKLTSDEINANKLGEEEVVIDKAPINTMTRLAVAMEPTAFQGLKVTVGSNFYANRNNKPAVDLATKKITNYNKDWEISSEPMVRLEYAINEQLHLRNTTTLNMDDFFEKSSKAQKSGGDVTNVTRLIYTFY